MQSTVENRTTTALLAIMIASVTPPVAAQMYTDFNPAGNNDVPANVYFGAARDTIGNYIHGATIVIATSSMDFVAITDKEGRFRVTLPVEISPSEVETRCSHNAYAQSQVRRRLPRRNALTPVEISCSLR